MLVVTALPFVVLFAAMSGMGRQWLPLEVVGMHPAAVRPDAPPSFYIDDRPGDLSGARRALFAGLRGTGIEAAYDAPLPSDDDLLTALAGGRECRDVLAAAFQGDGPATPARCVTAVEAKLYCEALGKRLPSQEEWQAALDTSVSSRVIRPQRASGPAFCGQACP